MVEPLLRVEQVYRTRLREEPTDTVARLSLAWCLFMQALHAGGRESVAGTREAGTGESAAGRNGAPAAAGRSRDLLDECLKQTLMIRHMSACRDEQRDVEKLHFLARMLDSGEAVTAAEEEAARVLQHIADDVRREASRPAWRGRAEER